MSDDDQVDHYWTRHPAVTGFAAVAGLALALGAGFTQFHDQPIRLTVLTLIVSFAVVFITVKRPGPGKLALTAIGTAVALTVALVATPEDTKEPDPLADPSPLATVSATSQPTSSPTMLPSGTAQLTPRVIAENAFKLCEPRNPSDARLPEVEICVVAWCFGLVILPNGQVSTEQRQVKLKPRIINNGTSALNISISKPARVRLLVQSRELPGEYRPPRGTAAAGDVPVLVKYQDQEYWAVPPNQPRDAQVVRLPDGGSTFDGFATYWDGTTLAPGSAYLRPAVRQGDLVFQIPIDGAGDVSLFGLALLQPDGRGGLKVLTVQERAEWPEPSEPASF